MPRIVTGQDHILGPWMCERQKGAQWFPGSGVCIGLMEGDEILCVVMYDNYNSANVNMHVASVPGKRWLVREYLWYCFYYPFEQLKVKRITGLVDSSNTEARKFDENLGFTLEATLKAAAPAGDMLVYCMTKQSCRWLHLKDKRNGKTESAGNS